MFSAEPLTIRIGEEKKSTLFGLVLCQRTLWRPLIRNLTCTYNEVPDVGENKSDVVTVIIRFV